MGLEEKIDELGKIINAYRQLFMSMHPLERDKALQAVEDPIIRAILLREWTKMVMQAKQAKEVSTE